MELNCTCNKFKCICDSSECQSVVQPDHWCTIQCQGETCENIIENDADDECDSSESDHESKFICVCDDRVIICDKCELRSLVGHNHWCGVMCHNEKCKHMIKNTTHGLQCGVDNKCYDEKCYCKPEFICTCDSQIIFCNKCEYKITLYHNHWCGVMCQKCKHKIQNRTHDHVSHNNECYSEECYHKP
jgi:hypothetical protein